MVSVTDPEDERLDPEHWKSKPNVCGSCVAWRLHPDGLRPDDRVAMGDCRLRPELGRVPADLKRCDLYKPKGAFVYTPAADAPKRRRAAPVKILRRQDDGRMQAEPARSRPAPPPPRAVPRNIDLGEQESPPVVRQLLRSVLWEEFGRSGRELAPKYARGGTVEVRGPGGTRSMPAERVFAVLDRLRSALDALDASLAAHSKIGAEKAEYLDLVKRMHGSLTSFNELIHGREDHFGKGRAKR